MNLSKDIQALLFVAPTLITVGLSNPSFWHEVVGRSKAADALHFVVLGLSFVSALSSFVYFGRGKISISIGFCLVTNGLWLILLTLGLIFALAFNGPG